MAGRGVTLPPNNGAFLHTRTCWLHVGAQGSALVVFLAVAATVLSCSGGERPPPIPIPAPLAVPGTVDLDTDVRLVDMFGDDAVGYDQDGGLWLVNVRTGKSTVRRQCSALSPDNIRILSERNDPDSYIQYHSANDGQPIDVSLQSFDQAVDGFIVQTITLLEQRGFRDTDLHYIYREVLEERNDPELAQIREAEARAGQDPPYQSDQPKDQMHLELPRTHE